MRSTNIAPSWPPLSKIMKTQKNKEEMDDE